MVLSFVTRTLVEKSAARAGVRDEGQTLKRGHMPQKRGAAANEVIAISRDHAPERVKKHQSLAGHYNARQR
jgi:hypothetical protein